MYVPFSSETNKGINTAPYRHLEPFVTWEIGKQDGFYRIIVVKRAFLFIVSNYVSPCRYISIMLLLPWERMAEKGHLSLCHR
jgi:hypothetical protein